MGNINSEPEKKPQVNPDQEQAKKAPEQTEPENQPPFPLPSTERPEQEPDVPPQERTKGIP